MEFVSRKILQPEGGAILLWNDTPSRPLEWINDLAEDCHSEAAGEELIEENAITVALTKWADSSILDVLMNQYSHEIF